jgi:hypothetical protein
MKQTGIVYYALMLVFMLQLVACGGGTGTSDINTGGGTVTSAEGASSSSGTASSLTITKTVLQLGETTTVSTKYTSADGTPAAGIKVNFSTTLGTLAPADGIATTDANGTATVQLTAGQNAGQGQVTATATVDNTQVSKSGLFSINLPPLTLSPITLGLSSLSFGGSTSVSVTVKDANGAAFTQAVDVVFTSAQAVLGKATINSPVRTVNGVATTTYQASTATGTDTITASISGSNVTATLTINPLSASAITFVSATPVNIGLKGMGGVGILETSKVTFRVLDVAGQPKANQQVDFVLNTTVGGLALTAISGSSGADGTVSTTVQAGTIATPVRVTATLRGITPTIATQSDQLVVSTGVPAQDGFSIAIETLNPECFNIDGIIDRVTARLSDHFHNPVPDGTAVSFTTSGGSIQPSCTTIGGACSVNWTSQDPRPIAPSSGRAVILAYAVGEEAFIDLNGNGVADAGEFIDTTEAFRDDNENGVREVAETFIDFNSNGLFNGPDGQFNGVLQGAAFAGAPKSKHVFSNATIAMSSSAAKITVTPACLAPAFAITRGSFETCDITVADTNGNTMPKGTTVDLTLTTLVPGTGGTANAFVMPAFEQFVFPNTNAKAGVTFSVTISNPSVATSPIGSLLIKVKSPGGLVTSGTISLK